MDSQIIKENIIIKYIGDFRICLINSKPILVIDMLLNMCSYADMTCRFVVFSRLKNKEEFTYLHPKFPNVFNVHNYMEQF